MTRTVLCVLIAMAATSSAAPAFAADIAWDKIIGAIPEKLSETQKNVVRDVLKKAANTRGCTGTVASCLSAGDLTARRHAGFAARMAQKGKDAAFIEDGIRKRGESAFPSEKFKPDTSNHPYFGNPQAKVVVTEYACFECPFCAHMSEKLSGLKQRFGDKIVYFYKFFPVRSHPRGVASAIAGVAAFRQGKFWELASIMFRNRTNLEDDDLQKYAREAGLDPSRFSTDIKDTSVMKYVEKDKLEGMRFGVDGTPAFFVNGKMYLGVPDYDELVDRIEEELDILEGRIP
jgi:protein-disulfide isomerase